MIELPDGDPQKVWESHGVYAIQLIGDQVPILAENCLRILPLLPDDNGAFPQGIWYLPKNAADAFPLVEKWVWIPYHAIARISFNSQSKTS